MASVTYNPKVYYRTLEPDPNGKIGSLGLLTVETGDVVIWLVVNSTPLQMRVKVKEFRKYDNQHHPGNQITVMNFIDNDCTVSPNGIPGVIAGQVTLNPGSGGTVSTKYTVSVKIDSGPWFDNDPDLDVNRPGSR